MGQLDEKALFYLRARGVGVALARQILIYAFASEIVNRISHESSREVLGELIQARLAEDYADARELPDVG